MFYCTISHSYAYYHYHHHSCSDGSRVIIFCETKKGCDQLTRSLRGQNYPARCIHGDKDQRERDEALADFRSGATPILIATDVAARGLDVKDVRIVVNFDMYVPILSLSLPSIDVNTQCF